MKLSELTAKVKGASFTGETDPEVKGLCFDSRKAVHDDLFFALKGENFDGIDYVESALKLGSTAVVAEIENPNNDKKFPGKSPQCQRSNVCNVRCVL